MISQSKFNAQYSGLNSVAKKVYEVTPMAEAWTVQQIYSEIRRLGISLEHSAVHGALGAMERLGLLRESPKGCFIREAVRLPVEKPEPALKAAMTKAQTTPPPAPVKASPAERLDKMDQRLNRLKEAIASISEEVTALSSDFTDALLDMQDQESASSEELANLRQLKSLLGKLGG